MDQSKLATWHVWCGTNIGHVWCGTNTGQLLVRNKRRMPDIFWCGTNAGHSFVHLWVPRLGTCGGGLRIGSAAPRLPRQHHVRSLSPHMRNAGCPLGRGRIPSSRSLGNNSIIVANCRQSKAPPVVFIERPIRVLREVYWSFYRGTPEFLLRLTGVFTEAHRSFY